MKLCLASAFVLVTISQGFLREQLILVGGQKELLVCSRFKNHMQDQSIRMFHKIKNKTLAKLCEHKNNPNLKILLLTVPHCSIVMMIKLDKLDL